MWERKNHGGEQTANSDKKYAIFIGRYQPYHHGHINLVMQKMDQGIPALIMVRDIEPDEKNPFTIEEQLYLKDINLEQLLSPRKKPMMPNNVFYGQGIEMAKTPIFATASLIQSAR